MSSHDKHTPAAHTNAHDAHDAHDHPVDIVEEVAHKMSYVLPIAGAILIFLLAFIAVSMA